MDRPSLPRDYELTPGWTPKYMVPRSRWLKINTTSGHPSAASLQEFLHDCPSGGNMRVLSASQADKARQLKRYGCTSEYCNIQGTLLRTIRYVHPDTSEVSLIVEHSTEISRHGSQNGPSTLIAFRDNIRKHELPQDDDQDRPNIDDDDNDDKENPPNIEENQDPPNNNDDGNQPCGDVPLMQDEPAGGFSRLLGMLISTTESSSNALVPVSNATILQYFEGASLTTEEELLEIARSCFDPQNDAQPLAFQRELCRLMPNMPSGLFCSLTEAALKLVRQDDAEAMLAVLDSEYAFLDTVENQVRARRSDQYDAIVRVYNQFIQDATSDVVKAHLLVRLGTFLLKYKTKANLLSQKQFWKPPKIQSGILVETASDCVQQALHLCNEHSMESRHVAELQRQERDGTKWIPLEAQIKFLEAKINLLQGEFESAGDSFKEAAETLESAKSQAERIKAETYFSAFAEKIQLGQDRSKHLSQLLEKSHKLTNRLPLSVSTLDSSIDDIASKLDECSKEALASTKIIEHKCALLARIGSWPAIIALLGLVSTANKNCHRALRVLLGRDPFPREPLLHTIEVEVVRCLPTELLPWYIRALRFVSKFSEGKKCVEFLEWLDQERNVHGLGWIADARNALVSTQEVVEEAMATLEHLRAYPNETTDTVGRVIQNLKRCLQENSDFSNTQLHADLNYWLARLFEMWAEHDYGDAKELKLETAADHYATGLKMCPQNVNMWLKLAKLHAKLAKMFKLSYRHSDSDVKELYDKALNNCLSALKINRECLDALSCRGDIFYEMKMYKSASTDYSRWKELYNNTHGGKASRNPMNDPAYRHVHHQQFAAKAMMPTQDTPRPRHQRHRRSISQLSPRTYKTMDNHERLGLDHSASFSDVKKAYRKFALLFHPDKPGGNGEMFRLLSNAYAELSSQYEE